MATIRTNPYPAMTGKMVKFALGSRESLERVDRQLYKVELYIDGETGMFYVVPAEERGTIEPNPFLDDESPFENFI